MADPFYTTSDAARAAQVSEGTLRCWAKAGVVSCEVTANGIRLFDLPEVLAVARARLVRREQHRAKRVPSA